MARFRLSFDALARRTEKLERRAELAHLALEQRRGFLVAVEDQDLCSCILHRPEVGCKILIRGPELLPLDHGQPRLLGILFYQVGAAGAKGIRIVQESDLW